MSIWGWVVAVGGLETDEERRRVSTWGWVLEDA